MLTVANLPAQALQNLLHIYSIQVKSVANSDLDPVRRNDLDTDAGGDYDEENAVCYLQILLASKLSGCSADIVLVVQPI